MEIVNYLTLIFLYNCVRKKGLVMANYLGITNKFLKSPFGIKLGNRFHVTGEKFIGNSTIKLNLSKKLSDGRFIDQTIFDYGNNRIASMTRKTNKNGSNFLSIVSKKTIK